MNNHTKKERIMEKSSNYGSIMLWAVAILLATLVIAIMPTESDGAIYEDTVRLHIIANSDGEGDQQIKLKIRDKLLLEYGEELSGVKSARDAEMLIEAKRNTIEDSVEGWLFELGEAADAKVELGREWYDTREYDSFTLPCGYYTSLRVILGEGEGKNWWCVMYPPLCLDLATETAPRDDALLGYTDDEVKLIEGGGYQLRFKLLELVSRALKYKK